MSDEGFSYFDVEADVGVHAWGPTPAAAFAQAALGVLALTIAVDEVEPRETREVRAQGDGLQDLLVNWINECLYVHEIEGFAVKRVEVTMLTERVVHGMLHGEPIDTSRHRPGTVVKAATYHEAAVVNEGARTEIKLIVDV